MNGHYSDNSSDGDWSEKEDLIWSEADWRGYLKSSNAEILKFISAYQNLKHEPNHLDLVIDQMNWGYHFSSTKHQTEEPREQTIDELLASAQRIASDSETEEGFDGSDPFTLHRHPAYVVTHGIYLHIAKFWGFFLEKTGSSVIEPKLSWDFSRSLQTGEHHAVLAIYALEMGDYYLTVCHLKSALVRLNKSLQYISEIPEIEGSKLMHAFQKELKVSFFDLREIWLRLMQFCREQSIFGMDD